LKSKQQLLLLLTATITPSQGAQVARRDPSLRRADYFEAFTYWLNHSDNRLNRILFIENSAADIDEFHSAASHSSKDVEIISIPPNPPPPGMHYGYSELQMIDMALSQSRLRKQTSHMIKATGRLIFPDLPKLLDHLPESFRLVVDARARLPFRKSERGFISVQLFLSQHEFYDEYLRHSYTALTPAFLYPSFVEHLFFELLTPLKGQNGILLRFPVNCEPVGFAGHLTKRYDSPQRLVAARARALLRVIAPDFWL
jgi:hypothetical protein